MKKILFLLFFFACASSTWATHNRAGYITFQYISPLAYRATIVTYTKASSTAADRDTLDLNWGDGTIEKVLRGNGNGHGQILENDLKYNWYVSSVHTYYEPCVYYISVTDPNRIANIINIIAGASVNIPLYIETALYATNVCHNSSALLLSSPVVVTNANDTFSFNPTIMDPDCDSLEFELTTPLQGHNEPVPNFQSPDEISPGINNVFSINHLSGEISW